MKNDIKDELLYANVDKLIFYLNENNYKESDIFNILKKRSFKIDNFNLDRIEQTIQELTNKDNFVVKKDNDQIWLEKKKFFPIEIVCDYLYVSNKGFLSKVKVLTDEQIEKLKSLNYGIISYKFNLSESLLYNVYCTGKHPNLNPDNFKFCTDHNNMYKEATIENIRIIENSFLQTNLHKSYNCDTCDMVEEIRRIIS